MGDYHSERLRIMTSKTLLAGLLTTLVFLILIEFSNSNPSGIRQVSSDGKENGVVQSLLELENKESKSDSGPLVRQKRRVTTTRKPTKRTTPKIRKTTKKGRKNSTNNNAGSPVLVLLLLFLSFAARE